ncbi:hypothetical protein PROSTU_01287 [Providencia stuartii ATCC 25827]|uniref:Uncharacterized protein n=1 Tax=Providencia stuartii ATCC 25827 TaxID=471874 RepID=A0AA87CUC2_PROST|nr:hypothetical protein PROSTU_01287 [Providencia stuartii ATCC 25827]
MPIKTLSDLFRRSLRDSHLYIDIIFIQMVLFVIRIIEKYYREKKASDEL